MHALWLSAGLLAPLRCALVFCSHRGLCCPRTRLWVDVCCLEFHLAPGWSQCASRGHSPAETPGAVELAALLPFMAAGTRSVLWGHQPVEQGTLICCLLLSVFWHRKSSSMPVNTWLRELSRVKRGGYSLSSLEKRLPDNYSLPFSAS